MMVPTATAGYPPPGEDSCGGATTRTALGYPGSGELVSWTLNYVETLLRWYVIDADSATSLLPTNHSSLLKDATVQSAGSPIDVRAWEQVMAVCRHKFYESAADTDFANRVCVSILRLVVRLSGNPSWSREEEMVRMMLLFAQVRADLFCFQINRTVAALQLFCASNVDSLTHNRQRLLGALEAAVAGAGGCQPAASVEALASIKRPAQVEILTLALLRLAQRCCPILLPPFTLPSRWPTARSSSQTSAASDGGEALAALLLDQIRLLVHNQASVMVVPQVSPHCSNSAESKFLELSDGFLATVQLLLCYALAPYAVLADRAARMLVELVSFGLTLLKDDCSPSEVVSALARICPQPSPPVIPDSGVQDVPTPSTESVCSNDHSPRLVLPNLSQPGPGLLSLLISTRSVWQIATGQIAVILAMFSPHSSVRVGALELLSEYCAVASQTISPEVWVGCVLELVLFPMLSIGVSYPFPTIDFSSVEPLPDSKHDDAATADETRTWKGYYVRFMWLGQGMATTQLSAEACRARLGADEFRQRRAAAVSFVVQQVLAHGEKLPPTLRLLATARLLYHLAMVSWTPSLEDAAVEGIKALVLVLASTLGAESLETVLMDGAGDPEIFCLGLQSFIRAENGTFTAVTLAEAAKRLPDEKQRGGDSAVNLTEAGQYVLTLAFKALRRADRVGLLTEVAGLLAPVLPRHSARRQQDSTAAVAAGGELVIERSPPTEEIPPPPPPPVSLPAGCALYEL